MASNQGYQAQSSGDFRMNQGALRILYSLVKDTVPSLDDSGLLQENPVNGAVAGGADYRSTTLPANVKRGVLGGSVAFIVGDMTVGGAPYVGAWDDGEKLARPVGLFINDAVGNAFENTPGVASGKAPYIRGGTVGVKIYETKGALYDSTSGDLEYKAGDKLYASINGLLTNRIEDSYEYAWFDSNGGSSLSNNLLEATVVGVVLAAPSTTHSELFVALKF
jgi:hypothetical protein